MRNIAKRVVATATAAVLAAAVSIAVATPASAASCVALNPTVGACSTVKTLAGSTWNVVYRGSVRNDLSKEISATCSTSQSKKFTHTVSTSVEANVKAGILGEMGVKAGYSFAAELQTTNGVSTTFKVPPKSTIDCETGAYTRKATGETVYSRNGGGGGTIKKVQWTSAAPTKTQWRIKAG